MYVIRKIMAKSMKESPQPTWSFYFEHFTQSCGAFSECVISFESEKVFRSLFWIS